MAVIQRVRTEWTGLPGGPGLSTMYFANGLAAQVYVDAVRDFWTALNSRISTPAIWTVQGDVDRVDDANGNILSIGSSTARTGAGTDANPMMSYGTQGLLNLRTGVYVGGREIRGKVYIPVPSTNSNADGIPIAAYNTQMQTAWTALLAGLAGITPVVYSPTNAQSQPVSAINPSGYFARLKSRQR